ncbi:FAD-dependent monooxygenase [Microbacterium trichothecenolyticum]|uniref:FAD-dependent monooxygenase n=1 Tax=Microbacterium trichothecenolyticum TaxID=69370 RepID=UPI00286C4E0D|nr:FAD-dependent monooxygenase [Microbacterium trichothecenolyticum]
MLVVGAGPTGLMLATCLETLGVRCIIVDGKPAPTREPLRLEDHRRITRIPPSAHTAAIAYAIDA